MRVKNPHDHDRWVPAAGGLVEAGAVVQVDNPVGKSLIAQGWTKVTSKTKTDNNEEGSD